MRIEATYRGQDRHGHHMLEDLDGDVRADHRYINGVFGNWPSGVPIGARVSFYASPLYRPGGPRITDVREVRVLD